MSKMKALAGSLPPFLLFAASAVLVLLSTGCKESGPSGICWMGVDSLFASGKPIRQLSDIPPAFANYVAYADSSSVGYPEGVTEIEFVSAQYFWSWQGRKYWLVRTRNYQPAYGQWFERETLHVDENGVFVRALGCI
jgi:hypothetical protein